MDEQWREIPDTHYSVSDLGRVVSRYCGRWRILKPRDNGGGYLQVKLRSRGEYSDLYVHRLIAAAFLPPRPTLTHQVNHIDGCKKNNRADNLEWMTPKQNTVHFHASHTQRKGPPAKHLTLDQLRDVRERLSRGETKSGIARSYGVSRGTIRSIFAGRTYAGVV